MNFYGIKDNKCHIDLTERTPEIASIEDLGYTTNTSLLTILQNMNENGMLIYSVSDYTSTNVYPAVVPTEDDAAIVIIRKVGNYATLEFHFYNSFYVNHYLFTSQSGPRLSGWIQVATNLSLKDALPIAKIKITTGTIPNGTYYTRRIDLSEYNISSDRVVTAIVTPEDNFSFTSDGRRTFEHVAIIEEDNQTLIFRVRNNSGSQISSLVYRICII